MSDNIFTNEEIRLFEMIAGSFNEHEEDLPSETDGEAVDYHSLFSIAEHHGILPIIYNEIKPRLRDEMERSRLEAFTFGTAKEFYQLLFLARDIIGCLSKGGVESVLLKGASAARFYPSPEARRSTDIDVFLASKNDGKEAERLLLEAGYAALPREEHEQNHHIRFGTPGNRLLELHLTLVEPLDDRKQNNRIDEIFALKPGDIKTACILGTNVPVLKDSLQALHLLLHMWMDMLMAGFGLKLLCDWTALWNQGMSMEETTELLDNTESLGLTGFLSAVTSVCIKYLGLRADEDSFLRIKGGEIVYEGGAFCKMADEGIIKELLKDVVDTERDGRPPADRMVALRGNSLADYFREFHHQTLLSFPRATKLVFPLPFLYIIVLIRFLRNNRTVREGQSARSIMKSAGERSRLIKELTLR